MNTTAAYAAVTAKTPLVPYSIERREPGPHEVLIDILYCGVCHSDIHQVRDEWGGSIFPMVPGHEIVGTVVKAGLHVSKWKIGDTVGVGCFIDSCHECEACKEGEEQFCEAGMSATYNGYEQDGKTPTYGGYSTCITVSEDYVLRRKLAGSLIGGIRETQEMLDFCAEHNVVSDVEVIPIEKINEAYERVLKSDVHYRFVIDMNSLKHSGIQGELI